MGQKDPEERNYVGAAVLTCVLYYVGLWLIGLIVNIIYLSDARRHAAMTGRSPSGTGCLWIVLAVHIALPLIAVVAMLLSMFGERLFTFN